MAKDRKGTLSKYYNSNVLYRYCLGIDYHASLTNSIVRDFGMLALAGPDIEAAKIAQPTAGRTKELDDTKGEAI
jgi:hypothetical protein